jgi:hypothetical protein
MVGLPTECGGDYCRHGVRAVCSLALRQLLQLLPCEEACARVCSCRRSNRAVNDGVTSA